MEDDPNDDKVEGWRMSLLLLAFATVTLILERILKFVEKLVTNQKGLAIALTHIKNELFFVGSISLLLSAFQNLLAEICIPLHLDDPYEPGRRLLGGGGGETFCPPDKQSLWPVDLQHSTHIFIFVVACTHIVYGAFTVYLTLLRVRRWRKWELAAIEEAKSGDAKVMKIPAQFLYKNVGSNWLFHWAIMIVRLVHLSVNQTLYRNARLLFIEKMGLPYDFDFHRVVIQGLEQELMDTLHPEWHLWLIAVVWFAIPPPAYVSFWMYGTSLCITLIIGSKLVDVLVQISLQVAVKYGDSVVFGRMDTDPRTAGRDVRMLGRSSMVSPSLQRRPLEVAPSGAIAAPSAAAAGVGVGQVGAHGLTAEAGHGAAAATAAAAAAAAAGGGGAAPMEGECYVDGVQAAEAVMEQLTSREQAIQMLRSWVPEIEAAASQEEQQEGEQKRRPCSPERSGGGVEGAEGARVLARGSAPALIRRQRAAGGAVSSSGAGGRDPSGTSGSGGGEGGAGAGAGVRGNGRAPLSGVPSVWHGQHLSVIVEDSPKGARRGASMPHPHQHHRHHHRHHHHRHHHHHHHHHHPKNRDEAHTQQQQQQPPLAPAGTLRRNGSILRSVSGRTAGILVAAARKSVFELFQRHPSGRDQALSMHGEFQPLPAAGGSLRGHASDGPAPGSGQERQQRSVEAAGRQADGQLGVVTASMGPAAVGPGAGAGEGLAKAASAPRGQRPSGDTPSSSSGGGTAGGGSGGGDADGSPQVHRVNDSLMTGAEVAAAGGGNGAAGGLKVVPQEPAAQLAVDAASRSSSSVSSSGSSWSSSSPSDSEEAIGWRRGWRRGARERAKRHFKISRTVSGRRKVPLILRPCYCGAKYAITKTEYVRGVLARQEAAGIRSADAADFFWFGKPRILTALFTLAYFQNSLSIAICIFSLSGDKQQLGSWEGVQKWGIAIQLALDLLLVPIVAVCVLPIYALIQPLGSHCPADLLERAIEAGMAQQRTRRKISHVHPLPYNYGPSMQKPGGKPGAWARMKKALGIKSAPEAPERPALGPIASTFAYGSHSFIRGPDGQARQAYLLAVPTSSRRLPAGPDRLGSVGRRDSGCRTSRQGENSLELSRRATPQHSSRVVISSSGAERTRRGSLSRDASNAAQPCSHVAVQIPGEEGARPVSPPRGAGEGSGGGATLSGVLSGLFRRAVGSSRISNHGGGP